MAPRSSTLDLRELPLKGGERAQRRIPIEIAPLTLGGLRYDVLVDGDEATVTVSRVSGGYLVALHVKAAIYGPCSRCLREMSSTVDAGEEEFVPRNPADWSPEDVSPFIEDLVVDVGGLARETVILALPPKLLCSEDCQGLCVVCGGVLNDDRCTCEAEQTDPRWDKLKGLEAHSDEA